MAVRTQTIAVEQTTAPLDPNVDEDAESRFIPADVAAVNAIPDFDGPRPYAPKPTYTRVDYLQSHWKRRRQILAAHPEFAQLATPDPSSALWVLALVAAMGVTAIALRHASWLLIFAVTYIFGAIVDHALWVLIHDLTHNLVFSSPALNVLFLCVANAPHVLPSAVSFRYYHRIHHSHLNETYADPDVPGPLECKIFGRSAIGKMLWILLFPLLQVVRTARFKKNIFNGWMLVNYIFCAAFVAGVFYCGGHRSLAFLLLSSLFSIGFHPVGARWVAEHYQVTPGQETYSYYGPLNKTSFNIGYHNEHHDLPDVPWRRLPLLTKLAPEFYAHLYQHDSYLAVLNNFFFDARITLTSRLVRNAHTAAGAEKLTSID
jgi:sphingolipid delta-4 desaturase